MFARFVRLSMAAAVVAAGLSPFVPTTADAQLVRSFTSRFSVTNRGDIFLVGNTLMSCSASAACTTARAGSGSNNDFSMVPVDIDAVDPGANSSSADLAIPGTATVRWAGLYWGARSTASTRNQARLRVAGSSTYVTVTASQLDVSSDFYSAFADVTSLVQAAGNGTYTVANVQALTGTNTFAGWSLVVVTSDSAQPPRNLVVFDGYANVSSTTVTIPVSGFVTPPSGAINTRLGAVVQEGDLGITGDAMQLNTTTLSDALNPAANFFNSSVSRLGTRLSAKNPDYVNQLGYDIDVINASGILANGATSATIRLSTSGDQYLPQAVTFATEVFEPVLQPNSIKTATDVNGGYLTPGDVIQYDIPVSNTGNDHADAVILRDVIPAGTTYVPGSLSVVSGANAGAKTDASGDDQAEFDSGNNRVVFRLGTGATAAAGGSFAPGDSAAVRFRVTVNSGTANGTAISNTATLAFTGRTIGINYSLDTNTVTSTVNLPDLTSAKSHSGSFVRGTSGTYSVVVTNSGFGPTSGTVSLTDTLPIGLAPTAASGTGWSCGIASQTVTCTRSDALAVSSSYPAVGITVSVAQSAAGTLVNTASVSGGSQQNTANDSTSDSTTIVSSADLSITKTGPATAVPGGTIVYTTTVSNAGPSNATSVVVTDPTPAGLSFVSNTGACTTGFPCSIATIAAGGSAVITSTFSIPSNYSGASPIVNTASVTSAVTDPNTGNESASASSTVVASADLVVSKTGPAMVRAGEIIVYTVSVTNNGPSAATSVVLSDPLPSGLTFVSNTGNCTTAYPCSLGTIPVGATRTVTTTFTVPSDYTAPDPILNTASASSAVADPNGGNSSSTASTALQRRVDLVLSKTGPASITPGSTAIYTITLVNNGPSDATNVVIADPTPAGLTFVSNSGNCTTAFPCSMGTVPAGATRTITAHYSVPASYTSPDPVVNAATVTSDVTELVPGDNGASASSPVQSSADLSIGKSGPAVVSPGTEIVFTVEVANAGPSDAAGVVVADTTPSGLTFLSATGDCTTAPPCNLGTIPAGQVRTFNLLYSIPSGYVTPDPISNTASVTSTTADPDGTDNSITASVDITANAGLSVVKTAPTSATPGRNIVYGITVTNHGPADATSVILSDPTPTGLTFVSNTGDCTGTFPCNLGTIPAGQARTIETTFSIPAGYTTPNPIVNTASAASATIDPNTDNNSSTGTSAVAATAGISISKSGPPFVVPGRNVVYTTTVNNAGPSVATNVVVTDPTPSGLTFVSNEGDCTTAFPCMLGSVAVGETRVIRTTFSIPSSYTTPNPLLNTATATSDVSAPAVDTASSAVEPRANMSLRKVGPPAVTPGTNVVYVTTVRNVGESDAPSVVVTDPTPPGLTFLSNAGDCVGAFPCNLGTMPVDDVRTIESTYFVPASYAGPDPVVNSASVTSALEDPVPDNNGDSASSAVSAQADLGVSKSGPADATPGTDVVYTVSVTNFGPSQASAVVLDDPTPADLTFVGSTGACTGTFPCALGTMAPGETRTATVTFHVPSSYTAPDPISNTASASSATPDPQNDNDSATALASPVVPRADLNIAKVGPASVTAGEQAVYTITITNDGPSDATSVTVVDPTPSGLTFVSNTGDCTTTFPCTIGTLPAGQTRTITTTFSVPANYSGPDPVQNTASLLTPVEDPSTGDESATASSTLVREADLTVTKTGPATATPGSPVVYTILVENDGPSDAADVTVSDLTPAGLTFVSTAGDCTSSFPCTLGTIPAGASRTITATFSVPSGYTAPDPVQNTVSVTSSTTDPAPGGETSTASSPVARSSDLSIDKAGPAQVIAGTSVVYTLTIANAGPSDASAVTVTDPTPAGLTFVSNTGDCTTAFPCGLGAVAAGTTRTITSTFAVPANYSGPASILNSAAVSSASSDPDGSDDSDSASTTVARSADTKLFKTGPASASAGGNVVYTITLRNDGPSDAANVSISDPAPAGTTFVSNSGACTGPFPCSLGTVAAGATRTITSTFAVASNYSGANPLVNTATSSSTTPHPAPETTIASASTVIGTSADLVLTKSGPGAVEANTNTTFTISVRNTGPSDAQSVVVTDILDSGLTYVSDTGGCVQAPLGTLTCSLGTVAYDETRSFTVTVHVDSAAPTAATRGGLPCDGSEDLCNQASVSSATTDTDSSDNADSESLDVVPIVPMSLSKSDSPDPVGPGETLRYTIVYSNPSTRTYDNVSITETYDPRTTFVTATPPPDLGNNQWIIGTVAPGESGAIVIDLTVSNSVVDGDVLVNEAMVHAESTPDVVETIETEATVVAEPGLGQASLSVLKQVTPSSVPSGAILTYTVTVSNGGPAASYDTLVEDVLPAGVTYRNAIPAPDALSGQYVAWDAGDLPAGGSASFQIFVESSPDLPAGTLLENTATATGQPGTGTAAGEGLSAEGSAVASVSGPGTDCRLVMRKRHVGTPTPGGEVVYRCLWCDPCVDAQGVTVADLLPAEVELVSVSTRDPFTTSATGVDINVGQLPAGRAGMAYITVRIPEDTPPGTEITNTISITDAALRSRTGIDTMVVGDSGPSASSSASFKATGPKRVISGGSAQYSVRYRDVSQGSAVTMVLPAEAKMERAFPTPTTVDGNVLTWQGLAATGAIKVRARMALASAAVAGTISSFEATLYDAASGTLRSQGVDTSLLSVDTINSGPPTSGSLTVDLRGARTVTPGLTTQLSARYRNLTGDGELVMTLPEGLTYVFSVPEGVVTGNEVRFPSLRPGSGAVKIRAQVAAGLVSGQTLAVGTTIITDGGGNVGAEWPMTVR